MKAELYRLTGAAIVWKGVQLGGVKILHIVRLLVLARLLAPEDFGLLAIATTASGFLLLVTDFGILPALVQRAEVDEKHYHAAWTVGFIRGLVITGGLLIGASVVAAIFDEPRAANIIRGLAIVTLIEQMASIRLADLTRNLNFWLIAITGVIKALADTIIAIALAPYLGVWALVAGVLAGSTAYAAISYIVAPYRPRLYLDAETVETSQLRSLDFVDRFDCGHRSRGDAGAHFATARHDGVRDLFPRGQARFFAWGIKR